MMKFEVSNDLNFLAKILQKDIFQGSLFDKRLLILPSEQMKSWLLDIWLESDIEVVSGIRFSTLSSSIPYLLSLIKEREIHFLSTLELKLVINFFLNELFNSKKFKELNQYLFEDKLQRITYLSDLLSDLFQNYSIYGADIISNFKNIDDSWQKTLFHKIFYENGHNFPLKELPIKKSKRLDLKIYLFGFTYMPALYFDFFHMLSKETSISIYYRRLTSEFWEDIQSVKQSQLIKRKYQECKYDLQDWTLKMFETNTFFANFGALGKSYEKTLGNYNLNFNERYFENNQETLLKTFQNHILNLDELDESDPQKIQEKTNSIVIKAVNGSKLEEVKVVYEKIQNILSDNDIGLKDVLVLAPDINLYLNHIKTVFDRKGGAISFKINDVKLLSISHLAKGIEQIFSLVDSDWSFDDILAILDNPLIQDKFQIEKSDIDFFQKIMKKTNLKFSYNEQHKKELLGYANKQGTWEESFQKIVMAYATFSSEFCEDKYPQLFAHIGQSDLQIIEPFFKIINSLYVDLLNIKNGDLHNLEFYGDVLVDIVQKYFFISDDLVESMAYDFIHNFHKKLKLFDSKILISLQDFRSLLLKEISKETTTLHPSLCNAIQFGSLGHDKWYPFQYVFMIGMDSSFPVQKNKSSLNLLKEGSCPTKSQFDRFTFLNTIINAKKGIWISYPIQTNSSEGSDNLPSIFVKELTTFLNKYYNVNDLIYDDWNLKLFETTKRKTKKWKKNNLLSINYPTTVIGSKNCEYTTYELSQLAANPIKFYLKKKHSISLLEEFEEIEEDFFLSPLNKYIFINEKLTCKSELNKKQLMDLLPSGIFKEIANNQLSLEAQKLTEKAQALDINLKEIEDIELTNDVSQKTFENKKLFFPAINLKLQNMDVCIVGKLKNIHTKGLVLFKENNIYEWIKNWPTILLYHLVSKNDPCFSSNILFLKSAVKIDISNLDAEKYLSEFLSYFLVASENIFPFTKSFFKSIIKNDIDAYGQSFHQILTKSNKYQDPFEKWFVRHFTPKADPLTFAAWGDYLNLVYYPIINELSSI